MKAEPVANIFSRFFMLVMPMVILASGPVLASGLQSIRPRELYSSRSFIILDARPQKIWRSGHIPGALSISWEDYTRVDEKKIAYRTLPPDRLATMLGAKGISETSSVVVYGDADLSWGGEGWLCWMLLWTGHKGEIRLLEGGIQAWQERGYPLSREYEKKKAVFYKHSINNAINISTQEIQSSLNKIQLVDTRSVFEWFKGSIPGAVHISWKKFHAGTSKKPINSDELKKLLEKNKIDISRPVVYFCTGGIRSAYAWTVHELAGFPMPVNYEGGTEAWKKLKKKD